jgi:GntR family transcriptional regulator
MGAKLYIQLKRDLSDAISRGDYKPHDRLPSQRLLSEQYDLSHMSVRRAINELIAEGVIYSVQGQGLYVAKPKQDAELGPLYSFTEDMALRGMKASSRVLMAEIIGASTSLAWTLKVAVGAPIVHLRRLRLADNEPMAVQSTFLPHQLVPELLKQDIEHGSLFQILRGHYDLRLLDGDTAAEAALADEEIASLLGLSLPSALLITEQITYLENGQPIEFARSIYRGDRYRLRMSHEKSRR